MQLVEAFHATLEEVVEADLLVVSSFSNYIFNVVNILCSAKLHQNDVQIRIANLLAKEKLLEL